MTELAWLLAGGSIAAVTLVTVGSTVSHRSDRPGAVPFVVLLVGTGALAVILPLYPVGVLPTDGDIWSGLPILSGYVVVSLAWAAFVMEFTGRGPALTRRSGAVLAALGGVTVLLTVVGSGLTGTVQLLAFVAVSIFQLSIVVLATFALFLAARSAITYGDLPTGRAATLLGGGLGLTLLFVPISLTDMSDSVAILSVMLGQLGATAALFGVAQLRYDLLGNPPTAGHLARETVLDTMSDAVVVVDREHRLLDANRAAERTFSIDPTAASGLSLAETVGLDAEVSGQEPVTLETTTGRRQFEMRRTPLSDNRGTRVGYAYRLRDVTDRQTREQRLQVLNRVLRHNLRNDLDAIRGFAEPLRAVDGSPDNAAGRETADHAASAVDVADLAERIRRTATDLSELGATVEQAEQLHTRETAERRRIALVDLAESVAAGADTGTVTVSRTGSPVQVTTDSEVLRAVLEELIDNAIEHNDSADPTVEIALEQTADGASIEVRDDGPGIPEEERTVLLEGEETPLKHGSGVGLWLVHWGVTRLGGTLSFSENEPRGSIVGIHVPSHDLPTSEGASASEPAG